MLRLNEKLTEVQLSRLRGTFHALPLFDASVNSSCAQPLPPPGYCRIFARLVSSGGGAFANFALPGGPAFANQLELTDALFAVDSLSLLLSSDSLLPLFSLGNSCTSKSDKSASTFTSLKLKLLLLSSSEPEIASY